MDQRIEPTDLSATRPATAKRALVATQPGAKPILAADYVRVVQAMAAALGARRDEVLRDSSPANVHAFRGALRRAGATLKLFKVEVGDRDETRSRTELKWLARQYGDVRDLDVLICRLRAMAHPETNAASEDETLLSAALSARERATVAALASTTSIRAMGIVEGFSAWAERWTPRASDPAHAAHIAALSAADGKVRGYGVVIGNFSSHTRHRLRARIKMLRYECEAMTQLTADDIDSDYVLKLTLLHQLLGDMHDTEVGAVLSIELSKPGAVATAQKKMAAERRGALKAAWSDFRAAGSPWPPAVRPSAAGR